MLIIDLEKQQKKEDLCSHCVNMSFPEREKAITFTFSLYKLVLPDQFLQISSYLYRPHISRSQIVDRPTIISKPEVTIKTITYNFLEFTLIFKLQIKSYFTNATPLALRFGCFLICYLPLEYRIKYPSNQRCYCGFGVCRFLFLSFYSANIFS